MPSQVSLDYQSFWKPQRKPRTLANPGNSSFMASAIHEGLSTQSSHTPNIASTEPFPLDNGGPSASKNEQTTGITQHGTPHCYSTNGPAYSDTNSLEDADSPLTSTSQCFSPPLTSRSTPAITQCDEKAAGGDEYCPIDPDLSDPVVKNTSLGDHILSESHQNHLPTEANTRPYASSIIDPGHSVCPLNGSNLVLSRHSPMEKSMASYWSTSEVRVNNDFGNLEHGKDASNVSQRPHEHSLLAAETRKKASEDDNVSIISGGDDPYPPLDYEQIAPKDSSVAHDRFGPTFKRCTIEPSSGTHPAELETEGYCHSASAETTAHVEPPKSMFPGIPSSPTVCSVSNNHDENGNKAEFEEWPLQNVLLKRIQLDGVVSFQLQFETNVCGAHSQLGRTIQEKRNTPYSSNAPRSINNSSGAKAIFTSAEDDMIMDLKESRGLSWPEIHRRHQRSGFHIRSKDSLQVRYCTKLKRRGESLRTRACLLDKPKCTSSKTHLEKSDRRKAAAKSILQRADDTGTYGVTCLLERRGTDEFLLEWDDGSTGWEPRENILDEEMIVEFETSYQGLGQGVDVLNTEERGGELYCLVRWHDRPSTEDEWVSEKLICLRRLVMIRSALHSS